MLVVLFEFDGLSSSHEKWEMIHLPFDVRVPNLFSFFFKLTDEGEKEKKNPKNVI